MLPYSSALNVYTHKQLETHVCLKHQAISVHSIG